MNNPTVYGQIKCIRCQGENNQHAEWCQPFGAASKPSPPTIDRPTLRAIMAGMVLAGGVASPDSSGTFEEFARDAMICPECHSTIQPNYRGACVTCLRRENGRIATLNAAMWEECVRAYHLLDRDGSYIKRGGALGDRKRAYQIARQATDAARRAAGETT